MNWFFYYLFYCFFQFSKPVKLFYFIIIILSFVQVLYHHLLFVNISMYDFWIQNQKLDIHYETKYFTQFKQVCSKTYTTNIWVILIVCKFIYIYIYVLYPIYNIMFWITIVVFTIFIKASFDNLTISTL